MSPGHSFPKCIPSLAFVLFTSPTVDGGGCGTLNQNDAVYIILIGSCATWKLGGCMVEGWCALGQDGSDVMMPWDTKGCISSGGKGAGANK